MPSTESSPDGGNPATPFKLTDDEVHDLGGGQLVQRDRFATEDEVQRWSDGIATTDASFTRAGTGSTRRVAAAVREDRTAWQVDLPAVFPGLRERFETVRDELNTAAWLGLGAFDVQLAIHGIGSHYSPHRDALRGQTQRRVTAILYLNSDWAPTDGGCLRIHTSEGTRDVEPRGGRLVVFLSHSVLHEVRPTRAVRHAATAWFRGR